MATPLTSEEVGQKISAAVHRVGGGDLKDQGARDRFLMKLPSSHSGTVGGNTACVEVRSHEGTRIILDGGTGICRLGQTLGRGRAGMGHYHIFLSHFHYDHIIGLPYFLPLYDKKSHVTFYSPHSQMEENLRRFLSVPFHPVDFDSLRAQIHFQVLPPKACEPLKIEGLSVSWIKRTHPNHSFAYRVTDKGQSFIYSTDTELRKSDFLKTAENLAFFHNAEIIVLDSQYTVTEAVERYDWGHSSYTAAVDFAMAFKIKKLFLFHFDPTHDDVLLRDTLRLAKWHKERTGKESSTEILLSEEGLEIEVP